MDKYDKTWEIVHAMAKAKLIMNDYKGEIDKVPAGTLLTLAEGEIKELRAAIASQNYTIVIEEAADIINFVMAAAHQVIEEYRSRKREHTR